MDDAQLLRYSRHILLPEFGIEAQERFAAAHALVVGAGGLGAPALQFLAAAGVGTLTVADPDAVDLTNLQRQILYSTADIGEPKVKAARHRIAAVNPDVRVEAIHARVGAAELAPLVARADVVLDCSDNFATRHAINRACVAAGRPLVSGAAIRFDGQIAVFDSRHAGRALLPLPVRRGRGARGDALRGDGRVRAAGRHRRRDAGRRGAEARRPASASPSPAGCCCSTRWRCGGAK